MEEQEPTAPSCENMVENVELPSQTEEPMIVSSAGDTESTIQQAEPESNSEVVAEPAVIEPINAEPEQEPIQNAESIPSIDQSEVVMQNVSQQLELSEEPAVETKNDLSNVEESMNVEEVPEKVETNERQAVESKMDETVAEPPKEKAPSEDLPSEEPINEPGNPEIEQDKVEDTVLITQPESLYESEQVQDPEPSQETAMDSTELVQAEVEAAVAEDTKVTEEKLLTETSEPSEPSEVKEQVESTGELTGPVQDAEINSQSENILNSQTEFNLPEEAQDNQETVPEVEQPTTEEPKPEDEKEKKDTVETEDSKVEMKSEPQSSSEGFALSSQISQVDVASVVAAAAAAETIASQDETSNMFEDPLNAVMNEVIETAANAKGNEEDNEPAGEPMAASESAGDAGTEDVSKLEPDSEDAVADVVAAVEKATAAAIAAGITPGTPSTPKAVKKKPKSPIKSANTSMSNHMNNSFLNTSGNGDSTSPTSSQKRRKKDPCAPKAPLNGYLVYFNEERAEMKKINPNIGFGELTKVIAAKWKDLPGELKQKYINEAEVDKERYVKEMADYKKSDAFKHFQKDGSANKIFRSDEDGRNGMSVNGPNLNWLQHEARIAGFDIPIFTEEFMDHCKSREHEMRQLRKEICELEQQNSVLQKHIENMKQSVSKTESDAERYRSSNALIQKHLDLFRQSIIHALGNTPLPNTQDYPTSANIDEYIMKLMSIIGNLNSQMDNSQHQFAMHVRNMLSRNNYNYLFELS